MQVDESQGSLSSNQSSPISASTNDHERFKLLSALRKKHLDGALQPSLSDTVLDVSMKKNLSFVKRLKLITSENIGSILSDLTKLKLEKYLAEAITSLLENFSSPTRKLTTSDLDSILQCVSALHLRFRQQFTPAFVEACTHACNFKVQPIEKEEKDRIQKGKFLVRFIMDLYLIGMFHPPSSTPELVQAIPSTSSSPTSKQLSSDETSSAKKFEKSSPHKKAKTQFTKFYQQFLLPSHENLPLLSILLKFYHPLYILDHPQALLFNNAMAFLYEPTELYYQNQLLPTLKNMHQQQLRLGHKANEWYYERGNMAPEDLRASSEIAQKQFEQLYGLTKLVSGYMKWPLPLLMDVQDQNDANENKKITLHIAGETSAPTSSYFEDEEQRQFYEVLPDLHAQILPNLSNEAYTEEEEMSVSELLAKLPNCTSTILIDRWALDFCRLATKSSHAKLAKTLFEFRGRPDLLPYYARLLAILKDSEVFTLFMEEFEGFLRRQIKSSTFRFRDEPRWMMVRFLSELVKFHLVSSPVLFFILKSFIDHFSPLNMELLCAFLEETGRFIHAQPKHQARFLEYLDRFQRMKNQISDQRILILIDSALLSISPTAAPPIKERSNLEKFLMQLLSELDIESIKIVAQKICKYPWHTPETLHMLHRRFTKLTRFRFHQLEPLACVLFIVSSYHPELGVHVVDTLIERIQVDLEQPLLRDQQKAIMHLVFLAHLFNVKLVQEDLIMKLLEFLAVFPLHDHPSEFFRIRLVISALNVCWKRLISEKLDRFLILFQFYIVCKNALPIDLEFALVDLFEIMRPGIPRLTPEEACEAMKGIMDVSRLPPPPTLHNSSSTKESMKAQEPSTGESDEAWLEKLDQELQQLQMEPSKTRRKQIQPIEIPTHHPTMFTKPTMDKSSVSVLTRKGQKAVTKLVKIDSESKLGQHVQKLVHDAETEHKHLKQFVLKYEKREHQEYLAALKQKKAGIHFFPTQTTSTP
ncbi:hypothetical protein HMI54_014872 [Coelomomyces lativittatus]|nr:hypothetical protein HMI54_014872 [Coelomomyces lativittatus]